VTAEDLVCLIIAGGRVREPCNLPEVRFPAEGGELRAEMIRCAPSLQLVTLPSTSVVMIAVSTALSTIWRHSSAVIG